MKRHVKIYLDAMGYDTSDFIPCEVCGAEGVDVHHIIFRSHGGSDTIDNLMALCRECHNREHFGRAKGTEEMQRIHQAFSNRKKMDDIKWVGL